MKVTLVSDAGEIQRVFESSSAEQFVDYVCANVQVVHELGEPIMVNPQGNDSLITVYNPDGSIVMHGPDSCDGCETLLEEYDTNGLQSFLDTIPTPDKRKQREWQLIDAFESAFSDCLRSGLLVDKAAAKAAQVVESMTDIEAMRDKAIAGILAAEFTNE